MTLKNPIIPSKSIYIGTKNELDYKAICVFAATGFFLEEDTYYQELKALKPATEYQIEKKTNTIVSQKPHFKWHYTPVERPLKQIVNEFASLFENIIKEQVGERNVILPLSGGLDSRTLAAALFYLKAKVRAYSYHFKNGHNESEYAKKIAKRCNFPFKEWKVPSGYLWEKIEQLSQINQCYSEFTHPRQMAFIDEYDALGDIFCLGHWGDVLFDGMEVDDNLTIEEQVKIVSKKIIKKGGLELAQSLWENWSLEGTFEDYFHKRVEGLLRDIGIKDNANAQIRAFKSLYWATRWTNVNLAIFESVKPISLPYFDDRMCAFICTVPEKYLTGRIIQIEYLKMRMPELARIAWQNHRPFNLYNYRWNRMPFNLPLKIGRKMYYKLFNKNLIQRNWELQFLGEMNDQQLKYYLFENDTFSKLLPKSVVLSFYDKFKNIDPVFYSHSVSMLLTLSLFTNLRKNGN